MGGFPKSAHSIALVCRTVAGKDAPTSMRTYALGADNATAVCEAAPPDLADFISMKWFGSGTRLEMISRALLNGALFLKHSIRVLVE